MDGESARYEFDTAQNAILGKAATWTGLFAWIMMGSAILMAIGAALTREAGSIGALVAGAVYFFVGLTFRGAASSMRAVVETTGNDMDHLMVAVDRLGSAFRIMAILFLVGVIVFVVVVVALSAWMNAADVSPMVGS